LNEGLDTVAGARLASRCLLRGIECIRGGAAMHAAPFALFSRRLGSRYAMSVQAMVSGW
jgi:hypothetical protein